MQESFFEEDTPATDADRATTDPALVVDVDGFEGPLDLLLTLARKQKVDLARISIVADSLHSLEAALSWLLAPERSSPRRGTDILRRRTPRQYARNPPLQRPTL